MPTELLKNQTVLEVTEEDLPPAEYVPNVPASYRKMMASEKRKQRSQRPSNDEPGRQQDVADPPPSAVKQCEA